MAYYLFCKKIFIFISIVFFATITSELNAFACTDWHSNLNTEMQFQWPSPPQNPGAPIGRRRGGASR